MSATDTIEYRQAEGEFAQQLPDIIEPVWWTGQPALDPALFTIDCTMHDMGDPDLDPQGSLATRMRVTFHDVGLVHLVNTQLTELGRMRQFAKLVLGEEMNYEGGSNPRHSIEPNVYEVGAPLTAHLHYHHEMAYVGKSTEMLAFMCAHALPGRGSTFVSDNLAATDAILATEFGQKLKELGVCYHRTLTDRTAFADRLEVGVYNHWQQSLGTEDPYEAVARAQDRGLVTEWCKDRLLKTRYYVSAFEYFPQLDRNVLYSSVADHGMWFDAWPLVQHLPYRERPLNLTFGDDSEMSEDELRQFVAAYDRFGIELDWERGDLAVICNYRFAHGRPAIHLQPGEDRKLGVLLGAKYARRGDRDGKW
ncbi:MAG: TauD/TfdA family dioxygenase [Acidimicrobiia bacterium]